MAQNRRAKTQARRSGGGGTGLPGWAWLVIGIALTLLVVLTAPKLFKPGSDGFFKPTPNPDAQPQPVDEEAVVDPEADAPTAARADDASGADKPTEYDFYRLLPGQEVPVSDAELAAREKAEQAERDRAQTDAEQSAAAGSPAAPTPDLSPEPLPAPVAEAPPSRTTPPAAATPPPERAAAAAQAPADDARYLLQAGAFEASGQAEELKAKIAMLGLGARVESARIGEKTVYRVRMGPYGTATELAEAKRKLASGGLPAIAIKVN